MKAIALVAAVLLAAVGSSQLINSTGEIPGIGGALWFQTTYGTSDMEGFQLVNNTVFSYFDNETVIAFNATNGTVKWQTPTYIRYGDYQYFSAAYGIVMFTTSDYVCGLNPMTGAVIFNVSMREQGYTIEATPAPVWNEDGSFFIFAETRTGYGLKLVHFDTQGNNMTVWNSTNLENTENSSPNWGTSAVSGMWAGSMLVAAGIDSYHAVIINASNTSGQVYVNGYDDFYSGGISAGPFLINGSMYLGGTDDDKINTGSLKQYSIWNGSRTASILLTTGSQTASYGSMDDSDTVTAVTWKTVNGMLNFLVAGSANSEAGSDCYFYNLVFPGNVTRLNIGGTSSSYGDCAVLTKDQTRLLVQDSYYNFYLGTAGSTQWTWKSTSIAGTAASTDYWESSATAAVFTSNAVWVSSRTYLNYSNSDSTSSRPNRHSILYQMDSTTGSSLGFALIPSTSGGTTYPPSMMAANPIGDMEGLFFMSSYSYGTVSVGTGVTRSFSGDRRTPISAYAGAIYFATSDYVYCYGANNGTLIWMSAWTSSSYSISSTNMFAFAGGKVFVQSSYIGDVIAIYDAFDGTEVTGSPFSVSASATGCPGSSWSYRQAPMVADDKEGKVYTAGRSQEGVIEISTDGTLKCAAASTNADVDATPAVTKDYIVFVDDDGVVFQVKKSDITSTGAMDRAKTSDDDKAGLDAGVATYQGDIYTAGEPSGSAGRFSWYGGGAKAASGKMLREGKTSIPGTPVDYVAPWFTAGQGYILTTNGSVVGMTTTGAVSLDVKNTASSGLLDSVCSPVPYPAITPFGYFIFPTSCGVVGTSYSGTVLWTIPELYSCTSVVGYRQGIAYVMCQDTLVMIDSVRGSIYQRGPTDYAAWVDSSSDSSLNIVYVGDGLASFTNLTGYLYAPGANSGLPASVNGGDGLLDKVLRNKIWIVGAAAGVVVLIIIIAVAVKLTGGSKNDSDYVAMSSNVNTGGV